MPLNNGPDGDSNVKIVVLVFVALAILAACAVNESREFFKSLLRRKSSDGQLHPSAPPLRAADHVNDGKYHLLLAATGSVATIKIPNIIEALSKHPRISVRLVLSESAAKFLKGQSKEQPSLREIAAIKNLDGVYVDEDEWRKPWVRGDSILHIELRRWADLMVIAPLSANSLANIVNGISNNLITSVVRAWDSTGMIDLQRPGINRPIGTRKRIAVAPAMNTAMWEHPVTEVQVALLENDWKHWFTVLRPVEKELACGDTGSGAMRDWKEIVKHIEQQYNFGLSSATSTVVTRNDKT